ncbi:MAG: hypothetical protein QNJ55_19735 [Xenococcus sp. MO_188.B8]|nr:hypothetical protein [Xenococcus sp. MO_188.B8]
MPKQNRVDPFGQIIAVSARGTLMGNRGVLHDSHGSIKKLWRSKSWITCLLNFKGQKRSIMSPGKYTELFFLDEATSFAAGHRPCSTCRNKNFKQFKSLWLSANNNKLGLTPISIGNIDKILHTQRILSNGTKKFYEERLNNLPNGTMISLLDENDVAYLLVNNLLLEWSPFGYKKSLSISSNCLVNVLTPKSIVNTFLEGYLPDIHCSASSFINTGDH